jgi:putative aldouronate transport system substrate-binding protein
MQSVSRRRFLEMAGLGVAGAAALSACVPTPGAPGGGAAKPGAAAGAGGGVKLPTYIEFSQGPKPDLAGNPQGLDPAFFKFPTNLAKTVTTPPGDGSDVSAIVFLTLSAPPPANENVAWQALGKALNVNLKLDHVSAADYGARVNVVLAGADIPDFIYNQTTANPLGVISGLPGFLRTRCVDLTPHLSGDAVKEYPNLAAYSNYTWQSAVFENKIYGLPAARPPVNSTMMFRPDLFEKAGVPLKEAPKNLDEFKRMLQAVTRPQENQWGIAAGAASFFSLTPATSFLNIFRVPNNWRLEPSGKLVKDIETEEWKMAVGFARELWSLGVWHPNTPTFGGTFNDEFMGGRFAVAPSVWGAYVQLWDILAVRNPQGAIHPMHPFAHDGGKASYNAGPGNFGVAYMRQQSSPDRIKMLLRVANYLAAPFGSEEWLLNYFGVRDVDHVLNPEGAPVQTERGRLELTATWRYITSPAYALFSAYRSQEFATVSHAAQVAMIGAMQTDPTRGIYSQTAFSQGILAQDQLMGEVSQIVQGRRPLSDLDGLVAEWRTKAGDKMRAEFLEGIEASKR